MAVINRANIESFLKSVGKDCSPNSTLFLLGGGALELLGGARPTTDLDYVGDDLHQNNLQKLMAQVADNLHIEAEPVPIADFIPLPENAE